MANPVKTALVSVSDKQNLEILATKLREYGYHILSTGGTARAIAKLGIEVEEVSDYTGSPELFNGRVKTLHPKIMGGILARRDVDANEMLVNGISGLDIVVVNLYPFVETIERPDCTREDAIENIDIGGISLIRAAAKNHKDVLVVVDPNDYDEVCDRIANNRIDQDFRAKMAAKGFRVTASYDAAIAEYLTGKESFPETLNLSAELKDVLRYGENPHQKAAYYRRTHASSGTTGRITQYQGKELSFNNIADTDAALTCVRSFDEPACVIVKHANPCGVAIGESIQGAYTNAFKCDPTSAFGGVIAFNRAIDGDMMATIIQNQFAEVIVAPVVGQDAIKAAQKRKQLRLLEVGEFDTVTDQFNVRSVGGGFLVQTSDQITPLEKTLDIVTERQPSEAELRDLEFAWTVVQHVKSNAIVFSKNGATKGIGAGQMNRVLSVRIAHIRAEDEGLLEPGFVMASDAFFPFRDGIDEAAKAGVTAVIHPGGSIRDEEVVQAANEHSMTMVVTGERHFKH